MVTPVASLAPMHDEPFLGSAAMASGRLTRHRLRTSYRRLYRDVYLPAEVELTAAARARAAWLSLGDRVTLAGGSAAALHGTKWLDAESPAEVIRSDRNHQSGIVVHDYELRADETMHIRGMQVTTPARTAFDVGRTRPAQLAIPMLDALLRATATTPADVLAVAAARPGARGVRLLTSHLGLVDGGAESPRENRLRLITRGYRIRRRAALARRKATTVGHRAHRPVGRVWLDGDPRQRRDARPPRRSHPTRDRQAAGRRLSNLTRRP